MKRSGLIPSKNQFAWIRIVIWVVLNCLTGSEYMSDIINANVSFKHASDSMCAIYQLVFAHNYSTTALYHTWQA